ncbi:uncharacterized protein BDV14DRAFT_175718 [Aspergillus stella-maris]|uniref:uncharacterized protein n=1 Tax=Aspergillus stella-maris TaxID=1810926 RepID=UPI003CCC91F4
MQVPFILLMCFDTRLPSPLDTSIVRSCSHLSPSAIPRLHFGRRRWSSFTKIPRWTSVYCPSTVIAALLRLQSLQRFSCCIEGMNRAYINTVRVCGP